MRLWSIHPKYLDPKGLVALWREALLAQKVLQGLTKGYQAHPQLERFKRARHPQAAIATYLAALQSEAESRGYKFDASKISGLRVRTKIPVTTGQVRFELAHLRKKLKNRNPGWLRKISSGRKTDLHPLFRPRLGPIEDWER
jgi:hypothetical protein